MKFRSQFRKQNVCGHQQVCLRVAFSPAIPKVEKWVECSSHTNIHNIKNIKGAADKDAAKTLTVDVTPPHHHTFPSEILVLPLDGAANDKR